VGLDEFMVALEEITRDRAESALPKGSDYKKGVFSALQRLMVDVPQKIDLKPEVLETLTPILQWIKPTSGPTLQSQIDAIFEAAINTAGVKGQSLATTAEKRRWENILKVNQTIGKRLNVQGGKRHSRTYTAVHRLAGLLLNAINEPVVCPSVVYEHPINEDIGNLKDERGHPGTTRSQGNLLTEATTDESSEPVIVSLIPTWESVPQTEPAAMSHAPTMDRFRPLSLKTTVRSALKQIMVLLGAIALLASCGVAIDLVYFQGSNNGSPHNVWEAIFMPVCWIWAAGGLLLFGWALMNLFRASTES
jgi:hypothetical protein